MPQPASQGFTEPSGASKAFSLHLNGDNYDYVISLAQTANITRNRAVNLIIEEHARNSARKSRRHPSAERNGAKP